MKYTRAQPFDLYDQLRDELNLWQVVLDQADPSDLSFKDTQKIYFISYIVEMLSDELDQMKKNFKNL